MDRRRAHERRKAAESAEIGELQPVADSLRRRMCGESLLLFLMVYFPNSTGKNLLSPAHVQMIDRMEHVIREGGRNINAVFRGFAKTTVTELAALWAALYGHRKYILVMGAVRDQADEMIDSIRSELESNELLAEDFPEVCQAFAHLDGKAQRCNSQTYQGEPTHIAMKTGLLVLPTIPGSEASAVIIRSSGLHPPRRGLKFKRPDGTNARPDIAIIDDPQTDESAESPEQVRKLISRIYKSVLGSSGHGSELACVINATPIEPGDAVEQLFDHDLHPSWIGARVPMVIQWPTAHETLWQEYRNLRHAFTPGDLESMQQAHARANAFYRERRATMDVEGKVTWDHIPLKPGERSALQHAYNLYFDNGPDWFATECQMSPTHRLPDAIEPLTARELEQRINGYKRKEVPPAATVLTAGVDVHDDVIYWCLVAWTQRCQGWVVDYGTWPQQTGRHFSKRSAKNTLKKVFRGKSAEDAVRMALEKLFEELGHRMQTDLPAKLGVDMGHRPTEVEQAIRTSKFASIIQPMRGEGVTPDNVQFRDYQKRPGWTLGDDWYIPKRTDGRSYRWLHFDAYNWKTWLWARWHVPMTDDGGLSLYGNNPEHHRNLSQHLTAESASEKEGKKLTKVIWENTGRRDNHWLDCFTMAAVAASQLGCSVTYEAPRRKSRQKRRREILEAARQRGM